MNIVQGGHAPSALLQVLIGATGIVIVTILAGISDPIANLLIVFIVGLWLLFLMEHQSGVQSFSNRLTNIERGSAK